MDNNFDKNKSYNTYFRYKYLNEQKTKETNEILTKYIDDSEVYLTDYVSNHILNNDEIRQKFYNDIINLIIDEDEENMTYKILMSGSNVLYDYADKFLKKKNMQNEECNLIINHITNKKSDIDIKILFNFAQFYDNGLINQTIFYDDIKQKYNKFVVNIHKKMEIYMNEPCELHNIINIKYIHKQLQEHVKNDNELFNLVKKKFISFIKINQIKNNNQNINENQNIIENNNENQNIIENINENEITCDILTYEKIQNKQYTLITENHTQIIDMIYIKNMFKNTNINYLLTENNTADDVGTNDYHFSDINKKSYINFYKKYNKNKNCIILSYNDTLKFKKNPREIYNVVSDFSLLRYKIKFFFIIEYKQITYILLSKSELLDISIPRLYDNIYATESNMIKYLFDNNKINIDDKFNIFSETFFFKNMTKINVKIYKYSIYGIILDLEHIIMKSYKYPWHDMKYKKRLYRLILFYMLFLQNYNEQILNKEHKIYIYFEQLINKIKDITYYYVNQNIKQNRILYNNYKIMNECEELNNEINKYYETTKNTKILFFHNMLLYISEYEKMSYDDKNYFIEYITKINKVINCIEPIKNNEPLKQQSIF
jgi:hypothetical protein